MSFLSEHVRARDHSAFVAPCDAGLFVQQVALAGTDSGIPQLQLFDQRPPCPPSTELMKILNGINHSGLGQVWLSGRGIVPSWQMKRDMLSPAYTTHWKDIPIARIS